MLPTDPERLIARPSAEAVDVKASFAAQRCGPQRLPPRGVDPTVSYPLHVWRAYVIRYDTDNHPSIQSHCDAGDITFNLCLRRTCQNGELVLEGKDKWLTYTHQPGEATIFWGDLMHHTHDVTGTTGERANLVLLLNFLRPTGSDATFTLPFMALSTDARLHILTFCDLQTVAYVAYTCRVLHDESESPILWRQLYMCNKELQTFYSTEELEERLMTPAEVEVQLYDIPGIPSLRGSALFSSAERVRNGVVNYGPDGWKDTYHSVLKQYAIHREFLRVQSSQKDQFFWRAIIGMYPVHNVRGRKWEVVDDQWEVAYDQTTESDGVPLSEKCPECMMHLENS